MIKQVYNLITENPLERKEYKWIKKKYAPLISLSGLEKTISKNTFNSISLKETEYPKIVEDKLLSKGIKVTALNYRMSLFTYSCPVKLEPNKYFKRFLESLIKETKVKTINGINIVKIDYKIDDLLYIYIGVDMGEKDRMRDKVEDVETKVKIEEMENILLEFIKNKLFSEEILKSHLKKNIKILSLLLEESKELYSVTSLFKDHKDPLETMISIYGRSSTLELGLGILESRIGSKHLRSHLMMANNFFRLIRGKDKTIPLNEL